MAINALIYCGPSLPKMGISKYQVYVDGLPYNISLAIQDIPEIEKLIVPIQDLDIIRKKAKQKGTPEYGHYEAVVMKYINKNVTS